MASCILVLGLPRSGTSTVAGVLHHLGVFMGENLSVPGPGNPKGSFEDLEFSRHHKSILNVDYQSTFYRHPLLTNELPPEYVALIRQREALGKDWGFKCPLLSFMFWHFKRALIQPLKVIATNRRFNESVDSWAERTGKTLDFCETGLARYLYARDQAIAELKPAELLSVSFDDLMNYRQDSVATIAKFVGRSPNQEAVDFIGNFRHFGGEADGSAH